MTRGDTAIERAAHGAVELPSGCGNAWVSRGGEYILTESPSFNPNVGSNVEWTRIEPAR